MIRCGKRRCTITACSFLLLLAILYAIVTSLLLDNRLNERAPMDALDKNAEVFELQGKAIEHINMDKSQYSIASITERADSQLEKDAEVFEREGEAIDYTNMDHNQKTASIIIEQDRNSVSTASEKKATSVKNSLRIGAESNDSKQPSLDDCDWVNFTVQGPPYFLTALLAVRIYEDDKSELKSIHMKQWLAYLRYAGVEHIYVFDLWELPGESQREELDLFIREGYVTYTDRHDLTPYTLQKTKMPSYQQCIDEYGPESTWQVAIDIDEYPFSSKDTDPGFFHRFVKSYSEANPSVSEITMSNFLYLGQKDDSKELLFDKLWRHTHGPSNPLVKPIYKPADIKKAQIHHNNLRRGRSRTAPATSLRMNHYWGARLQNWGPDTPEILRRTEEDRAMDPIVTAFKTCKQYLHRFFL